MGSYSEPQSERMWNPEDAINRPMYHERHMRVICIGAGASGLVLAYKLQRSFEKYSLTVYEKNKEVSGTWYENRYPGCACDVAAHNYTFSFEPKPDWSAVYATSAEIYAYFNDFTDKYDLRKFIKTQHTVVGAEWNDANGEWLVDVQDNVSGSTRREVCDILINASGILNAWKWPKIPGVHSFKGPKAHSAAWDNSISLEGKSIALVGNGSSGIQILPEVLPKSKKITNFIRSATWIAPPLRGLDQHKYTPEELDNFKTKPGHLLAHRKKYQTSTSGVFPLFLRGSETQQNMRNFMEEHMKSKLQNAELEKLLIPNWSVGCRRLTPGIKYLEALKDDRVCIVQSGVKEFTTSGCITENGDTHEFDVLVCATGFDVSFKPRFPLLGCDKKDLRDVWKDEAKGYLGVAAPEMPNYFVFLGPNCPIGNGPVLKAIEAQADYMLKWCGRWQTENIRSFTPKWEAVEDFVAYSDKFMQRTVWTENCSSWYKGNSVTGRVSALWLGSTLHYIEALEELRADDYDIVYIGNRFAWFGNGFSEIELDETADWAYYITEKDESLPISKGKRRKLISKSGSKVGQQKMGVV